MTRFANSFEGPLIVYIGGKPKWVSREEYIKLCYDGIPEPDASVSKEAVVHFKFYPECQKQMIVENDRIVIKIPHPRDTHDEWRQANDKTE